MSQHEIETKRQEIERLIATNVPTSTTITQLWRLVVSIASALLILTRYYYDSVLDFIEEIRHHIDQLESADPHASISAGTNRPAATTAQPASHRPIKCAKCHARGHSTDACHSKDPAAVRRRIAANRKARGRRRIAGELAPAPIPSWSPLFHPTLQQHAFMALPGSSNIVAESAELRRRAAQSARDRRRARKGKTATSSQPK